MNFWLLGEQYFNLLHLKMTLKCLETFCYSYPVSMSHVLSYLSSFLARNVVT